MSGLAGGAPVGKVLILGLGLIGGSLARSLRQTGFCREVWGWGQRDVSLKQGMEQGVIDAYSLDLDEALADCDIAVLCTPTLTAGELLGELARRSVRGGGDQNGAGGGDQNEQRGVGGGRLIITDVASVKGNMVRAWKDVCGELAGEPTASSHNSSIHSQSSPSQPSQNPPSQERVPQERVSQHGHSHNFPAFFPAFVPGHPIAGSERSGVGASRADLFKNHRVILTPIPAMSTTSGTKTGSGTDTTSDTRITPGADTNTYIGTDPDALALVRALWESTGAEVVELGVEEHDTILAATSHLPHVLAYALVDTLARSDQSESIFRFAAGGFRDFTRIASSSPEMWRDIALANRDALLGAVDNFSGHLATLRRAVAEGDGATLEQIFTTAKERRDSAIKAERNTKDRRRYAATAEAKRVVAKPKVASASKIRGAATKPKRKAAQKGAR